MQKTILILLSLLLTTTIHATPAQVIIIRHAEKPTDSEDLSLKGRERAAALAPYFMGTPELKTSGTPIAIYATRIDKHDTSKRTFETVEPLSKALGLLIKQPYTETQTKELAHEILTNKTFNSKTILICWEHNHIPRLARELGVQPQPSRWPNDVFDQIWLINYSDKGRITLTKRNQALLFGDKPQK